MRYRKRSKRQRKIDRGMSDHHILPVSRGGTKTVRIHIKIHQKYHALFSNLTPDEIAEYLVFTFWDGYVPQIWRIEQ